MGFVLSVLYFVTYYLTPATLFGPLEVYRIESVSYTHLQLRNDPNRPSAGGEMFREKMAAGILLAALRPLDISRIIERCKMNLVALVRCV